MFVKLIYILLLFKNKTIVTTRARTEGVHMLLVDQHAQVCAHVDATRNAVQQMEAVQTTALESLVRELARHHAALAAQVSAVWHCVRCLFTAPTPHSCPL